MSPTRGPKKSARPGGRPTPPLPTGAAPAAPATAPPAAQPAGDAALDSPPAAPKWARRARWHALAALSGCLVFLSFPTWDLWPLLWVSLVPLLFVLEQATPRQAAWYGWVAGTVTNAGGFYWIDYLLGEFGHLPALVSLPLTLLLAAYQGTIFLLWAWVTVWLRRRTRFGWYALAPAVFVLFEWLVPLIFPWYLANGQYRFHAVTQIVELTGVLGLTGLLVLVNVALWRLARALLVRLRHGVRGTLRREARGVALSLGLLALVLGYGLVRIAQVDAAQAAAPKLRVGMVEANVGIWEKEAKRLAPQERLPTLYANLLRHQLLSRELAARGAELIVWPESSFIPIGEVWTKSVPGFALAVGADGAFFVETGEGWVPAGPGEGLTAPPPDALRHDLHAAWSGREDVALVAGARGTLLEWDGRAWTAAASGVTSDLRAVHGVPEIGDTPALAAVPLRTFAAGDGGALLSKRRGGTWESTPALTTATLRALAGRQRDAVYALGDGGAALAFDGEAWRRLPDAPGDVTAADVAPDRTLWVVGRGGLVARFGPAGWERLDLGVTTDLHAVRVLRADLVLVAGAGGAVFRWDGAGWHASQSGVTETLRGLTLHPRGDLLFVGDAGRLLATGGGRQPSRLERPGGGPAELRAVAALDYAPQYPIPHGAAYIRPARTPLPEADGPVEEAARLAESRDRATPPADRNTVQRGFDLPVIFGAVTDDVTGPPEERERSIYNTAFLLGEGGRVEARYDKVYLLMFGEYIPPEGWFSKETRRKLHEWLPEAGNFTAGTEVVSFPFRGWRLGVMVCYEDILPRFAWKLGRTEPNVFVNVTNDAWFGQTAEPYLHLALATFRTIEHRLALVRSTNTGVSVFVDPVGRIVQETSLEGAETLLWDVPMMDGGTVYAAVGDVFAYAAAAWVLWAVALGFAARWRERRATARSGGGGSG
jgi:apolipoprotein N-acyltransferase